jgi:hypothetical protein
VTVHLAADTPDVESDASEERPGEERPKWPREHPDPRPPFWQRSVPAQGVAIGASILPPRIGL